jgi:hypothetical protein
MSSGTLMAHDGTHLSSMRMVDMIVDMTFALAGSICMSSLVRRQNSEANESVDALGKPGSLNKIE